MLATFWSDIRYSVRTLLRNPAVTALAVVTIALGVGVNAGIFTTVNGLLFRDLSAPDAHELVTVTQTLEGVPGRLGNVAPGGFTTAALGNVFEVLPALARLFEVHAQRRISVGLLETYLGRHTGKRVLEGAIKHGDGRLIHAVIWFCDLRDSTALADSMDQASYLATLNRFFTAMAGAIIEGGGEILSYIGDAVLAIFPQSVYLRTEDGMAATVPPGTTFAIGMPGPWAMPPRHIQPTTMQFPTGVSSGVTPTVDGSMVAASMIGLIDRRSVIVDHRSRDHRPDD